MHEKVDRTSSVVFSQTQLQKSISCIFQLLAQWAGKNCIFIDNFYIDFMQKDPQTSNISASKGLEHIKRFGNCYILVRISVLQANYATVLPGEYLVTYLSQ